MEANLLQISKPIVYAIDASSANKQKKSGVEMYAFQLIQHMKQHVLADGERVVLYSPTKLEGALAELPNGWESRILKWSLPFGWMQGRVSWELFRRAPNVLFVPSQGLPRIPPPFRRRGQGGGLALVTTIHDIGFRRFPNLYDASSRKRIAKVTARSIHHAAHLFTVSEFSKHELELIYKTKPDHVTVASLAADTSIYKRLSSQEIEPVLQQHRLGKHFFLYVGRLDQKKNVELVVRAFDQFKKDRGVGDPFELVLVGEPGFGFFSLKKWLEESSVKEMIHVLGYLPDADVSALMNVATAFLFPSWYEGFGIPNVEAMCCGTPLLVSDIPVHHEVLADAAIFLPPDDVDSWVRSMKQIAIDLQMQESLRQKGFERSKQFDWNKTAEETWKVLRGLV